MNIIEAREAAMAGKTVISCDGQKWRGHDFDNCNGLSSEIVFGEWREKQEPIVFEAVVELADASLFGSGRGLISDKKLHLIRNKKVRVTVEVVE